MTPTELQYTTGHEWVKIDGDTATIGITDYAQKQLGDITYVELPVTGKEFKATESIAVIESVKAASDVYTPIAGSIAEINEDLEGNPESINNDPYNAGWICKLTGVAPPESGTTMSAEEYEDFLEKDPA